MAKDIHIVLLINNMQNNFPEANMRENHKGSSLIFLFTLHRYPLHSIVRQRFANAKYKEVAKRNTKSLLAKILHRVHHKALLTKIFVVNENFVKLYPTSLN